MSNLSVSLAFNHPEAPAIDELGFELLADEARDLAKQRLALCPSGVFDWISRIADGQVSPARFAEIERNGCVDDGMTATELAAVMLTSSDPLLVFWARDLLMEKVRKMPDAVETLDSDAWDIYTQANPAVAHETLEAHW